MLSLVLVIGLQLYEIMKALKLGVLLTVNISAGQQQHLAASRVDFVSIPPHIF